MSRRSIRSWIDAQVPEPESAPTDADQAAERKALLEELTRVEHELATPGEYREQLSERLVVGGKSG